MYRLFLLLCFFTLQHLEAQKFSLPAEVEKNIQSRITQGLNPSIVVGIIDANGPQYYSFGLTRAGGNPVDEHSIYEIGSISKTFTATLLADQVMHKKMKTTDLVKNYLPADVGVPVYPGGGPEISLGHLSDHTSALPGFPATFTPSDPSNPFAGMTVQDVYDFLSSYTLTREVGTEYEYSNMAVGLLGNILASAYGLSYEEAVEKVICKPLKMKETAITFTPEMKANLAYGHAMGMEVANWDLPALAGAGAIRSSVHDLLIYLAANMGLKKTELADAMMFTHQVRHDKANGGRMGLGWHIGRGTEEDIFWHTGGTGGYRTFSGFMAGKKRGVVVMTNTADAGVEDIGFHLLDPASPLREVKPVMSSWIKKNIDEFGPAGLTDRYHAEMNANPDKYDINEEGINALGYDYLGRQNLDAALAVFYINVLAFPGSSNVYDSYGEALMKNGQQAEAIVNYQKSLELNPGNTNGIEMLAKMGVVYSAVEIKVDPALLESYAGTYELVPGFNIVITTVEGRLFAQATGQSQLELYPKSDTEFYLKVVEARVVFAKSPDGVVSMTLYQNGQVLPGKRI